jgi:hypothetical protein
MRRISCIVAAAAACITTSAIADCGTGQCDGERPQYQDEAYLAFGGGQIAVATQWRLGDAQGVLNVYDLSGQGAAPLGVDWPTNIYSHPDWVASRMGSLFGVALDDRGNIFTTHTAVYFSDTIGSIGGQPGQVYKVDTNTGVPTVFATLPNNSDPVIAASPAGIAESYPGLGNLCFDVEKQMVYVSNFEDGRIYRIDASGACLSTWDHATGIVGDCLPEAGDGEGAAPLGERVWAVQTFNGRVYYSIWTEDQGAPSANGANEIWSVAYDALGEFIAGTEHLEVSMPTIAQDYSNPVSDIAFNERGNMMAAERTMITDTTTGRFNTSAHQSRALEFVCDAASASWFPSSSNFLIGSLNADGWNSAGGCDYSYAPAPDDRVWVTGDALLISNPENVYGIQGVPQGGGNVPNSILIDLDADILQQDKTGIGSVEVSCPDPTFNLCSSIANEEILCDLDDTGNYTYTFDLTNTSGQDALYLIVLPVSGGATVVPSGLIMLDTPLLDGETREISITFNGGVPGDELCFILSLNTADFEECCAIDVCIVIPECECAQIHDERVECLGDGTGCFTYTFDVDNMTGIDIYYSFFVPLAPAGVTITTNNIDTSRWDYAPLANFGTETITVTICGAMPGQQVDFLMTMHDATLDECCSIQVSVIAPDCTAGIECAADCNGDGELNFFDISTFLTEYANEVPRVDFTGDGEFNFFDVSAFLSLYAQGCP